MASDAAEQYLRSLLARALDGAKDRDIAALVDVLYGIDLSPSEHRAIQEWWTASRRGLPGLEAFLKRGRGLSMLTEWSLDDDKAMGWLKRRVAAEPSYADMFSADLDVLVDFSRSIDIARSTAVWRTSHPNELPLPVLIRGETGTGKDLLAQAMHAAEVRALASLGAVDVAHGAFGPLNCAGMPETLIESELFGYEANAFTGAHRQGRPGLIEDHAKGTVFLDEIGDAPASVQVRLLRFLNDGEVRRIGATKARRVFPWLMAATNHDLPGAVQRGTFREDLLNRLSGHEIWLKPLRKRGRDAEGAFVALICRHLGEGAKDLRLTQSARAAVRAYPWSGNLRAVDIAARRFALARVGGAGPVIVQLEDLPAEVQRHYVETTRNVVRVRNLYADLYADIHSDQARELRDELVRVFGEMLEKGEVVESQAIDVLLRLVRSQLVQRMLGEQRELIADAIDELAASRRAALVAELQAQLAYVDGRNVATVEPARRSSSDRPPWLNSLMVIAEQWLGSDDAASLAADMSRILHALPEPVRRAGEHLLLVLLAESDNSPNATKDEGERAAAIFEPWPVVRSSLPKLRAALRASRSAEELARHYGISVKTIQRAAERLGTNVRTLSGD